MNKRVLFTGGTGFIGKNVIPQLQEHFEVFAPSRFELDLFDGLAIANFIVNNHIDIVVHSANPNPSRNEFDCPSKMIRDSLQMFLNIYNCRQLLQRVVFLGSGAVYDKSKDIISVKEIDCFGTLPPDDYGFAKYIMNYMVADNGYGPGDDESKFITHCIRCCLKNEPITIRQNCIFDYIHVTDLGKILIWIMKNQPRYNMYNACSGVKISLLEIANIVKQKMNSPQEIVFLKDGWNNEYTGSNDRLTSEYFEGFLSINKGIDIQIEWETKHFKQTKKLP